MTAENRLLTLEEMRLARWMLENGAPEALVFLPQLDFAEVTPWKCPCGCASIQFQIRGLPEAPPGVNILGDFQIGEDERMSGVFIFQSAGILSGIEVHSARRAPRRLPDIAQLRPLQTIPMGDGLSKLIASDAGDKSDDPPLNLMPEVDEDSPAAWLVGTWRSDRERTIEAWGAYPPGPPKFQEIMLRDLGKLEHRYDGTTTRSRFDDGTTADSQFGDETTSTPYQVAWQTEDQAFVVFGWRDDESGQHLYFNSPVEYYVHTGRFLEYFKKVGEVE